MISHGRFWCTGRVALPFFVTSHGKTCADGIAGTLKRLATKASLQSLYENHILNSKQLYKFAVREIKGMSFCYVTNEEYEDAAKSLKARFAQSKRIIGTQKLHSISKSFILVKDYSSSFDR